MYSFESRVRYSETDTNAQLSVTGLMNYLQDCSIFQSEDIGVGLSYLQREKKAWLLSSWQIQVLRRPEIGEKIKIATWPYDFKGIYGMRNFAMYDSEGNYLVKANSCWFLTSTETGKPIRAAEEDRAPYGALEPRIPMEEAPRKIALPAEMEKVGEVRIMRHQLDTNHHVNNAQYVDIACEVLQEGAEIREIRAEYKKAAVLGDEMSLFCAVKEGVYVISLRDGDGSIFANVQLKTE